MLLWSLLAWSCSTSENKKDFDKPFTVSGDPFNYQVFTLDNGMQLYFSVNSTAPRIQTSIVVKAGSKFDPASNTGLAHYLEHMLFKGSHRLGTLDWQKEKLYLDTIEDLYEQHFAENDESKRKALYKQIDEVSYRASKLCVANEYDKVFASLGGSGSNAFTDRDMTVYIGDIPSNAIEKWMKLESDRFKHLVLRLFHTELEAVYEEFNISQDRDEEWSQQKVDSSLMPHHPYGTQTTIGLGEHLKKPSMVAIKQFFDKYYVPNNMAIVMSGNIDIPQVLKLAKQYFGDMKAKPLPAFKKGQKPAIDKPIETTYTGISSPHIYLGFRFDSAASKEAQLADVVRELLQNQAGSGLLDLNLVQQQKVLYVGVNAGRYRDMGTMLFYAEPKQGQSLEEVRDLVLGEIENLKQGRFSDEQLSAISKNQKLSLEELKENNFSRSWLVIQALSWNMPWEKRVKELNETGNVTSDQVIDFANRVFKNNYAICYKQQGEPQRHKVEKPPITPVETNNQLSSAFKKQLDAEKLPNVTPKYVDFKKDIKLKRLGKLTPYFSVVNPLSKKFTLTYVYPVGTLTYPSLAELEGFLELLGTKDYTSEEWKKKLYEKALVLDVSTSDMTTTFTITGLDEMLADGAQMLNHFKTSWKPDAKILTGLIEDKLAQRKNNLADKDIINNALASFGYYGAVNPRNKVLSNKQLQQLTIDSMTAVMNRVQSFQPEVVYVGSLSADKAHRIISKHHEEGVVTRQAIQGFLLPERKREKNEVYFCHFDQKQTQFAFIQNGPAFNPTLMAKIDAFNQYFGSGISSLMYQEIREKQGLAYSSYSSVNEPEWKGQLSKLFTYVGTQADKLPVALSETRKLMTNIPVIAQQWDVAKTQAMKTIETDWLMGGSQYWYYRECRQLGLQEDPRKVMYEDLKNLTLAQMLEFYNNELAKAPYTLTVMGNRKLVPDSLLQKYGNVKELNPAFLLGY